MKNDKQIKLDLVKEITGHSKSTIYKYMKEGKFPQKKKRGSSTFWLNSEIQEYIKG